MCCRSISEAEKSDLDLSFLRVLYNGAEPVRADTLDRFSRAFAQCGFRRSAFFPCYGLAEATLFVSGGPFDQEPARLQVSASALERGVIEIVSGDAAEARELVSAGIAAPEAEIAIVEEETRGRSAQGRVGAIWIRSGSVAAGYWNNPVATEVAFGARLADGEGPFLRTGDLGFLHENQLYVTGRTKDVIIIRGRNLYPQDIEAAIGLVCPFAQVNSCAAVELDGGRSASVGIVIEADRAFTRTAKSNATEAESLAGRIRAAVAEEFEVAVARIVFVRPGSFPRTTSGKVQRRACRAGLLNGSLEVVHASDLHADESVTTPLAVSGDLIRELHDIVVACLNQESNQIVTRIDPDESLLRLGIDSLGAARVSAAIMAKLGRAVAPDAVYTFPTLRELSRHLAETRPSGPDGAARRAAFVGSLIDRNKFARSLKSRGQYFYDTPFDRIDHSTCESAGASALMLSSFSYLGLVGHKELSEATIEAIEAFGVGAHGARLISGTSTLHSRLESRIARFMAAEAAIVFPAGFQTNFATIGAIVGSGDVVIGDELNHASIVDGCKVSGAEFLLFRHNDLSDLENRLNQAGGRRTLVVVDAVFSMDGDIAPLPEIIGLCHGHGALLMVDEAHSIGVVGRTGRGVQEHFGLPADAIDFKMGTLSKALGSQGGFVATSADLACFLRHNSRGYMFSTASPAPIVAAALKALEILEREPDRVERLRNISSRFLKGILALGFRTTRTESPIIPLLFDDQDQTLQFVKICRERGLFVVPIFYPVVPMNSPRVRITVTAGLSDSDIDRALDILGHVGREVGLIAGKDK